MGILYQARIMMIDDCGVVGGGNRSTRRKPAPVPLHPQQIPHNVTWYRTRSGAVGSRWRFGWAVTQPTLNISKHLKNREIFPKLRRQFFLHGLLVSCKFASSDYVENRGGFFCLFLLSVCDYALQRQHLNVSFRFDGELKQQKMFVSIMTTNYLEMGLEASPETSYALCERG
jgi:hypothetical protein